MKRSRRPTSPATASPSLALPLALVFVVTAAGSVAAARWWAPAMMAQTPVGVVVKLPPPPPAPPRATLETAALATTAPATTALATPTVAPQAVAAPTAAPVATAAPPSHSRPLVHLVAHYSQARSGHGYRDGTFTGPSSSAYWGWVQVQAVIRGGNLVDVRVLRYPSDRSTSRRIAHIALPRLAREVIRAQSTRVHAVSGATLDSRAFLRSMHGALRRAAG